ncbi:hypothetical protein MXEN_09199 [Mycobacterium xenopi RIVM700367]|nr:hypothetical protein MXEN_09199 [Mycobacterium xenopi RIVM700367]
MPEVVKGNLDRRILKRSLENLAIRLENRRPDRLSLCYGPPYCLFEEFGHYFALDYGERDDVPVRIEATGLLRKPYIQLSACQRMRVLVKLH